jgi:intraflagellar transport protein 172
MKESVRSQGRVDQLGELDLGSALDLMAEERDWPRLLTTAKQHGAPLLNKYTALYASHLIKVKEFHFGEGT